MNSYRILKEKHQKETNDFPKMFAFNKEQFEEGKSMLGVKENKELCKIPGGGFIRKSDKNAFIEMFTRHEQELKAHIKEDTVGDKFIYDMFVYELSNHEYSYTMEIDDTLDAVNLTYDDIINNSALLNGLNLAKEKILNSEVL